MTMRLSDALRRRLLLSLLLIVVGQWIVRLWRDAQPDETWRTIQTTGVLRIGMDASFPPFSMVDESEIVGLDADLAAEIGRRLGVRIEIVNISYDGLYDGLLNGRVDVLISALSFDPMRFGTFLYTSAYVDAGAALVSLSPEIQQMEQVEGKRLAVEYGSSGDEAARIWERRLKSILIKRYTTTQEALDAVIAGEVDAALVDLVSVRLYRRAQPALVIADQVVSPDPYVIATRRRSFDLAGKIQAVLNELVEDGTMNRLLDQWL
jgi:polar amino acid transport system substrate-binding protein